MIFADASAVVAILGDEPEGNALIARLEDDEARIISGLSKWESIAGLVRSYGYTPDQAIALVDDFLQTFGFTPVAIGSAETEAAVLAYNPSAAAGIRLH